MLVTLHPPVYLGGLSILVLKNKHLVNRCGAEAARKAHNLEVTGSKPVAGILQFVCFKEAHRQCTSDEKQAPFTGVAQRQRARLITLR